MNLYVFQKVAQVRPYTNYTNCSYTNCYTNCKTLTRLALEICRTPEEFKAWSQNYGHADVLTTLTSYGEITVEKQSELIKSLSTAHSSERTKEEEELFTAVLNLTRQGNS